VWLLIACRLQTLAFTGLYDYRTGKQDWMSAGCLPRGTNFQVARVHLLGGRNARSGQAAVERQVY
jgi:hypothetical protein